MTNLLLLCFFTCAVSCSNVEKPIKVEHRKLKNSANDTLIIETIQFSDGRTQEQLLNKNYIRNGYIVEYLNDNLNYKGKYTNNKKDSTWVYYTRKGEIEKVENWLSGIKFGEQKEFYNNGKIKSYSFNNIQGRAVCEASFNYNGVLEKVKGSPVYLAYNTNEIEAGSKFEIVVFFGTFLQNKYFVHYTLKEQEVIKERLLFFTNLIKDSTVKHLHLGNKFIKVKKYDVPGSYDWSIKFSLTDSIKRLIHIDSLNLRVIVR